MKQNPFEKFLWILPFIVFAATYVACSLYFKQKTMLVPNLIGCKLNTAIKISSACNINLKIIEEKEDSELEPEIIINQYPKTTIKEHQTLFIVLSSETQKNKLPDLTAKKIENIASILNEKNLNFVENFIADSSYPENSCIAQNIIPNTKLKKNSVNLFFAKQKIEKYCMPNFINLPLQQVLSFISNYNLTHKIYYKNNLLAQNNYNFYHNLKIINQRPTPGSLIKLNKNLIIELEIE